MITIDEQERHAEAMLSTHGLIREVFKVEGADLTIADTSMGPFLISLKCVEVGDTIRRLERDGVRCRRVVKDAN